MFQCQPHLLQKVFRTDRKGLFDFMDIQEYTDAARTCTLPGGLRLIYRQLASPVAYCGYAINAGTRDEAPDEPGMAHFVEHLLFKGTARRKAWHILNRMENVGGDLNAYTNKEETVVHAAFLACHFTRAAELLTDIVFRSTFPQREIEKETEVIIDEIQSYEDTPSELIFDDFEDLLFRGHPLGRNILGTPAALKTYATAHAAGFVARHYRPDNMVFFFLGNLGFDRVRKTLERLTEEVEIPVGPGSLRTPPPPYVPARQSLRPDTHQAHVMLGCRAYDAHNPRRTALYLLNNLLGGPGMNSRLNVALRERRGLVYNVESNLASYTDTGVFSIYFGCDPADAPACLRLCHNELKRLRDKRLSPSQLAAAKKQLEGQIGVASDNHENNALSMAKTYLHYGRHETVADVCRRVEALTADDLLEVANEILDESRLSLLTYGL